MSLIKLKICRLHEAALVLLMAVSLGLYLWRFDSFQVGTYMDDAQYIVLSKSIVEGHDYGFINPPNQVLPTRYPFGWPLILAPVYALFSGGFQSLKMVSLFFTLTNTFLIATCWEYLALPSRAIGLATAGLYALSPMVVGHARMVMSEPAFTFFVLLALILTYRSVRDLRFHLTRSVGLGVIWMFVAYVRTIGFALLTASMLYLIIKRRWPTLALAAVGLITALTLVVASTAVGWDDLVSFREYRDQFINPTRWGQEHLATNAIPRVRQGFSEYLGKHLRDSVVPFIGGPTTQGLLGRFGLGCLPSFVSAGVLALVATGYLLNIRSRGFLPVHFFVPLYVAITLLWPWRGARFLYGILPYLFAYLLLGGLALLRAISERIKKDERMPPWVSMFGLGAFALLLFAQFAASVRIEDSLNHVRDFRVGTAWLRENTAADALVVAEQPQAIYLYSQRATVALQGDVPALKDIVVQQSPAYLLIAPKLVWSNNRELEYSTNTRMIVKALQSGTLSGELVFEDEAAKVQVYLLTRHTDSAE